MELDTVITLVIVICIYMWPIAIIAASDRTRGNEKTYWMLATIFLSWFGLIIYRATTLSQDERRKRHREKLEYEHKKELAMKRRQLREQQEAAKRQAIDAKNHPEQAPLEEASEQDKQNADPHVDHSA